MRNHRTYLKLEDRGRVPVAERVKQQRDGKKQNQRSDWFVVTNQTKEWHHMEKYYIVVQLRIKTGRENKIVINWEN